MADPLLTSLCSICHVSAPKYKCPRCSLQTCSLPCIKKHKAWSECSGQRDPTAYVHRTRLRTAAGVDHDYNFLHGIEVSVERSEKLLIEEKGLVQQEELRPLTMQQIRWKTGRDGRKRKVLVTQVLREAKARTFEKGLAQKLKWLNVQIVCVPTGMARQKENHTTLNRRTWRINWQVEWLTFAQGGTTRALSKVMENVPLYEAYPTMLEERARVETGQGKRPTRRTAEPQSCIDGKWNYGIDCAQDPTDGHWDGFRGGYIDEWPAQRKKLQRDRYKFFLAGQQTRSDMPSPVTALDSGECLRDILANTRVVEFPTIYVLPSSEKLPSGYVLAPKDTIEPQKNLKRKDGPLGPASKTQGPTKRMKQDGSREDGEVESGNEDRAEDEDEVVRGVGLEAGEIIAEQSFGEEDSDDDDTSSSGSDSESD